MKKLSIVMLFVLLAVAGFAQTAPVAAPVSTPAITPAITPDALPASAPTFLFGAAVGINPYATSGKYSGVGTFAVRIPGSNLWSWSTLQMVPGVTTGAMLSTGAAYTVKVQGPWSITAILNAGITTANPTTGSGVTLGTFSGGGVVSYTVSEANKLYVTAGMTVTAISGAVVQPSFGIGLAKGF